MGFVTAMVLLGLFFIILLLVWYFTWGPGKQSSVYKNISNYLWRRRVIDTVRDPNKINNPDPKIFDNLPTIKCQRCPTCPVCPTIKCPTIRCPVCPPTQPNIPTTR